MDRKEYEDLKRLLDAIVMVANRHGATYPEGCPCDYCVAIQGVALESLVP